MSSLEELRSEVRGFIDDKLPQELRVGNRKDLPGAPLRGWIEALADRGWICPEWPSEYGGAGLDRKHANVIKQELRAVRAPIISSMGIIMLGPTLLEYGTEEQKKEFLPRIARQEMRWCQGYSEPGAGSDLASLQTRAELNEAGDEYTITGQKIWTTGADKADWIFCLVGTDFDAPKHEGISFILFDMHQPEIEVAPLRLIDGSADFSQVFFNGAKAKASHVVGPVNGGWTIAKRLLQHERSVEGGSEGGLSGTPKETYVDIVKREVGMEDGRLSNPAIRQRLAQQELDAQALKLTMARAREEARSGQVTRDIGSLGKYRWANMVKAEQDLVMTALGAQGLGWDGPGFDDTQLERTRSWLLTRADSIWGGTNEVQLNVIAKRVLQIPE